MANREAQIRVTFQKFSDLFSNSNRNPIPIKTSPDGRSVWCPGLLPLESNEGISLKGGLGKIRISETLNDRGSVVEYIYRFISDEFECLTAKTKGQCDEAQMFNFHFDKVENNIPHPPHVTVLYPSLRYISRDISLEEFLGFIQEHFFTTTGGILVEKTGNIWASKYC